MSAATTMTDRIVTAFAPATVSNVACGFDVLGFALEAPGDEVTARFTSPDGLRPASRHDRRHHRRRRPAAARGGAQHRRRRGAGAPDGARRAAGRRAQHRKGLPLASGLGGSAASAAAAVVAVDALLEAHAPLETLIACAIEGEGLGAGSAHPDNIAPALCGGFVLVRHPDPPDIVRLPVPGGPDGRCRPSRSRNRDGEGARAARRRRCRWPTPSGSGRISARSLTAFIAGTSR